MARRPAPTAIALTAALCLASASSGCRAVSRPRLPAEAPPSASSAPSGRAPAGAATTGPTAGGATAMPAPLAPPSTMTDPEPMPELTPERSVGVHLDLGRIYESKGQLDAAEGEYRRALEAPARRVGRETRALAHRRLAAVLDRQGKFADSAEHHRLAMKLAPRDARPWNDAGYSAYLQGEWEEAVRLLRKAEAIAPDDPRVLTNLGLALAASGASGEAMAAFERAGGPAAARANLGYVLAASGRPDEARALYEEAARLAPDDALARQALGRLDASPLPSPGVAIAAVPAKVDPAVAPASFEALPPSPVNASLDGLPPLPERQPGPTDAEMNRRPGTIGRR